MKIQTEIPDTDEPDITEFDEIEINALPAEERPHVRSKDYGKMPYLTWTAGIKLLYDLHRKEPANAILNFNFVKDFRKDEKTIAGFFSSFSSHSNILSKINKPDKWKSIDLGGGDQKKLNDYIKAKAEVDEAQGEAKEQAQTKLAEAAAAAQKVLTNFSDNKIILLTGGTYDRRVINIKLLKTVSQELAKDAAQAYAGKFDPEVDTNTSIYALNPAAETMLSMLPSFDFLSKYINESETGLILLDGSTDTHLLVFKRLGNKIKIRMITIVCASGDTGNDINGCEKGAKDIEKIINDLRAAMGITGHFNYFIVGGSTRYLWYPKDLPRLHENPTSNNVWSVQDVVTLITEEKITKNTGLVTISDKMKQAKRVNAYTQWNNEYVQKYHFDLTKTIVLVSNDKVDLDLPIDMYEKSQQELDRRLHVKRMQDAEDPQNWDTKLAAERGLAAAVSSGGKKRRKTKKNVRTKKSGFRKKRHKTKKSGFRKNVRTKRTRRRK